jgi:outer membrane immunogenic protein
MRNGQDGAVEKMKKTIAISVSALVLLAAGQANAADMYRAPEAAGGYKDAPAYTAEWAGFYAGVNGGFGWAGNNQLRDPQTWGALYNGLSPEGGFGGGQIGYNWQGVYHPRLVLGVEADIEGSDISSHRFLPGMGPSDIREYKSNLDYLGTVRGRLGYAFDRTLIYFTGGFAYGGLHKWGDDYNPPIGQTFNGVATGYVLGGGLEYKIGSAWSLKAEYQYLNLGKNDICDSATCLGTIIVQQGFAPQKDDDYHTVRVGLNYHVLPGYEPLK